MVAAGWFQDGFTFAGKEVGPAKDGHWGGWVIVLEPDGRERFGRARPAHGPIALDPAGRLALVERTSMLDPVGCTDELARWDLTGKELWRRPIATCAGAPNAGAFARGVAIAPSGAIWVQGDADRPFDLGNGTLTPQGRDWWLLRVAK